MADMKKIQALYGIVMNGFDELDEVGQAALREAAEQTVFPANDQLRLTLYGIDAITSS
jgi:hypothetical protein